MAETRTPSISSAMIEVNNLWKVFGPGDHHQAVNLAATGADRSTIQTSCGQTIGVRDVSFNVAPGESFVVMGLSGSGKSTLIRCLSGLHDITQGTVTIDGTNMVGITDERLRELRRTKMAMVFQHFGLFPHRKVIDNVAYGLEVQGVNKVDRRRRAGEVLSLVGLDGWADHYPDQLSGGMQQRVGLGRALALDPEILFFDEPFSALDPLIRHDMQDELMRLQREQRRTIVFITHDFDEALRLGDRIAVMKDGVFEQIGTPEEVVAHPATEYVTAFTRNVSIGKVLRAQTIMSHEVVSSSRVVSMHTSIEQLIPLFLADSSLVAVADADGNVVGSIGPKAVADVMAARQ
jgi:glycine betaine/proline transport system ATP-binding protein